jgi:hypothetical protein
MFAPGIIEYSSAVTGNGFITEWTVSGDVTARTITLPLVNTRTEGALAYNCTVKWGDGSADSTVTAFNDADRIHTYAVDGTYEVEIIGQCEGWSMATVAVANRLKLTDIIDWGTASVFYGFKYLRQGFFGCTNLKSYGPNKIIASGTGVLTQGFQQMFISCSAANNIPDGLFDNHPNVTTVAFSQTFEANTALTSIPDNLFDVHTAAASTAFNRCFFGTSISSIPTDLFIYNTAVSLTGFTQCFQDCTLLETVPDYLFRYNVACTNFQATFANCNKLQQNQWTFCASGEETTRFLNKSINFLGTFLRTSFTGTQGTAPELWSYSYGTGTPSTTQCWNGAGNSSTSLTNYASIPAAWK